MARFNVLIFIVLCAISAPSQAFDRLPSDVKKELLQGNYEQAIPALTDLAKNKNSQAQYQLALFYLKNKSTIPQAEKWLIEASNNKHRQSSLLLGQLYTRNTFEHSSNEKAYKYLSLAIKLGDKKAKKLIDKLNTRKNIDDKHSSNQIYQYIKKGNIAEIKKLVHNGVSLSSTNSRDDTPLLYALKNRKYDIAQFLLTLPAASKPIAEILKIDMQDQTGNTALHYAAIHNQFKISHLLYSHHASVNIRNNKKQTPLILAIINKNKMIAQQLVNQKADLDVIDSYDKTAINYATENNIKLVLPTIKHRNLSKKPTLQVLKKSLENLKLQINDIQSPYFESPLLTVAVAQKQHDLTEYLLKIGYSPWDGDSQHKNAITTALLIGDENMLQKLISGDLPKNVNRDQLIDVIKHVIAFDKTNILTKLLNNILTNDVQNWPVEQSPLWYAIKYNKIKSAIAITRKIPPDNKQNKAGYSYLIFSAKSNLTELTQHLISFKLNVNLKDNSGKSALWYAVDNANEEMVSQLLFANAKKNTVDSHGITPLIQAVIKNCVRCVKQLIKFGVDANIKTPNGNNALMFAAQGKKNILPLLLTDERRPNIKTRNNNSYTALMLAVKSNCFSCVQILLEKGANPNRKSKQGESAIDLSKNNPKMFELLNNH